MTTDTKAVTRWDWDYEETFAKWDGDYVLHSDHEAEVARLRAEVEGLRTTLEVIAVGDSRTPHIDAAQALLRSGYWTDEIDAAMGASA